MEETRVNIDKKIVEYKKESRIILYSQSICSSSIFSWNFWFHTYFLF